MLTEARSSSPRSSSGDDRFTRKARVLLDLFGPSGVERLRAAGLPAELLPGSADVSETDETAQNGRRSLLRRLRDRGLLDDLQNGTETPAAEPTRPEPLSARIAENLDGGTLDKEHPAVIALVLRAQPRDVRMRLLKAMPGGVARAAMRYLKD